MGYKHHGVKSGGIPVEYIERFVSAYGIKYFIETGTAGGESVCAVATMFEKCHTIEVVSGRPSMTFPDNVSVHEGDSAKLIGEIANQYKEPIFFWLDAHWSEPHGSPDKTNECPLLQEIEAIKKHQGSVILIDDARLFYGRPPWPCDPSKGWPRFMHVFDKLRQCFPDHIVTIVDDYILCCPLEMRDVHNVEWYERYNERFPSDDDKLKQSVKETYKAFRKYIR